MRQNYNERKSNLFLIVLLSFLAILFLIFHFRPFENQVIIREIPTDVEEDRSNNEEQEKNSKKPNSLKSFNGKINPNKVEYKTLIELGLPSKVANNWIKYIQKGGKFNSLEDLNRIYQMSPQIINKIKNHISFDQIKIMPSVPAAEQNRKSTLLSIDPNLANYANLIAIGFPAKQASTLLKYREKGGQFHNLSDLKKIYGMTDSILASIDSFLFFPPLSITENISLPIFESIDINTSDTVSWKKLPGIGSTFAKRIIAYREKLGGFYSSNQIKEVYGMQDSIFQKILPYLEFSVEPKPIYINKIESNFYHPYLPKKDLQILLNYRSQHEIISKMEELYSIKAFDSSFWTKIKPYLDFSK